MPCGNIDNLPRSVRESCDLPNGAKGVSLVDIDRDFTAIPCDQRSGFIRRVLDSLSDNERFRLKEEMRKSLKKTTELDAPVFELCTFLAVGHFAIENDKSVPEVVDMIVAQRSAAGIIYANI